MSNSLVVMVYQDAAVLEEALKQFKQTDVRHGYTWLRVEIGDATLDNVRTVIAEQYALGIMPKHQAAICINGIEQSGSFMIQTAALQALAKA